MFNSALILALLPVCGFALGSILSERTPAPANATIISPGFVPVTFVGNVAAMQATDLNGDTRLFYQNADGSIQELAINGPFTGGTLTGSGLLVPVGQAMPGTPMAIANLGTKFTELHVFFVSPSNILSEYIWLEATGSWHGGASGGCTTCVDVNRFTVQSGSKVLYAMGNSVGGAPATLRVGFVSAGIPGTLAEVDFTAAKGWQLAQLPG
ncbi:hypothetical protein DFH09DRAFT_441726 [Mycena vulgaris]|nr:hypothetical protein DFH09DRAFT_441726 [Mycena vulgaris]